VQTSTDDGSYFGVCGSTTAGKGSATIWNADSTFTDIKSIGETLIEFPWTPSKKNDSPQPRDPNFFKVDNLTPSGEQLWAFEGAQKMCYYGGHDFYSLGSFDESDDYKFTVSGGENNNFGTLPYDYGDTMFAAQTFFDGKTNSTIMSTWSLEGDCDWSLEEFPPVTNCPETSARGWMGVHSLPRVVSVEEFADGAVALKFSPMPSTDSLKTGKSETQTADADSSDASFDMKSQTFSLEVSFDRAGDSFEFAASVLKSADGSEETVVGIKSAEFVENSELIYVNEEARSGSLCGGVEAGSVADANECKQQCDDSDECFR